MYAAAVIAEDDKLLWIYQDDVASILWRGRKFVTFWFLIFNEVILK